MKSFLKKIPWYGYVLSAIMFGMQYGIYRLAELLSRVFNTASYAILPKIDFIDNNIPLIPFFVVIYLLSYVFWMMGPIAVSLTKKSNLLNYVIGYLIALFIGALIFLFLPTYMNRVDEGLIEQMNKPGFFNWLLKTVYGNDGGEKAFNLFPSYHCLISLYCYLGIRKQPEIKKWYKVFCLVSTILICLSTVFTKQHYFIDIVGGISIAIIVYIIVTKIDIGGKILKKRELNGKN